MHDNSNPRFISNTFINSVLDLETAIDFKSKEELVKLATIMADKAEKGDYPEILKLAYADAKHKVEILSFDQLMEIKKIINS